MGQKRIYYICFELPKIIFRNVIGPVVSLLRRSLKPIRENRLTRIVMPNLISISIKCCSSVATKYSKQNIWVANAPKIPVRLL